MTDIDYSKRLAAGAPRRRAHASRRPAVRNAMNPRHGIQPCVPAQSLGREAAGHHDMPGEPELLLLARELARTVTQRVQSVGPVGIQPMLLLENLVHRPPV